MFTTSFGVSWKSVERKEIVEHKTMIMVINFDNYSYLEVKFVQSFCLVNTFYKFLLFLALKLFSWCDTRHLS